MRTSWQWSDLEARLSNGNSLVVNYRPQKFLSLLTPIQYARGHQTLSHFSCESLTMRDYRVESIVYKKLADQLGYGDGLMKQPQAFIRFAQTVLPGFATSPCRLSIVGNWEHWQLSTLNLLRHGGVEYVTDDDDEVLHSTKSYGVVRRWLCKVVYVTSARKPDGGSLLSLDPRNGSN